MRTLFIHSTNPGRCSGLARAARFLSIGLGAAWLTIGAAHAADYTESVSGDLSNDRFSPTHFLLTYGVAGNNGLLGNNVIAGTLGGTAPGVVDRDYLNVTVPTGFTLSELRVGQQTTVGGGGSFIGLAAGTVMPVAPDAPNATGLLGWRVYQLSDRGTDILDDMQIAGDGASDFERPLPSGEYTFWFQELALGSYNYRFNLILSPVPEPSTLSLLAGGALAVVWAARRRRNDGWQARQQDELRGKDAVERGSLLAPSLRHRQRLN